MQRRYISFDTVYNNYELWYNIETISLSEKWQFFCKTNQKVVKMRVKCHENVSSIASTIPKIFLSGGIFEPPPFEIGVLAN